MFLTSIKKVSVVSLFSVGFICAASSSAMAADGAELYKAKGCESCHGAAGNAPIMASYPKLGGQNADYLLQQLKDFKSGARTNAQSAVMKGMVAAVSEEEMAAISKYLESAK